MSQLRENLNPGLEAVERQQHHMLHVQREPSSTVNIVVDPPSSDEAEAAEGLPGVSAGNDSDPPIENENPEDNGENEKCFDAESYNSNLLSNIDAKNELENSKGRSQAHHRKRKKSTHNSDGNYIPPYKKNRFFRRQASVLPSKFLLGGNIRDPLNLASLSDARISAELNRVTPQSSPLPVLHGEVPVFIPKNPHDPLGLTTRTPENAEDMIAGIGKNTCRKHRHRKRPGRKRTDSECSIGTEITEVGHDEDQANIQLRISEKDESKINLDKNEAAKSTATEHICQSSSTNKRKRTISEPSTEIKIIEKSSSSQEGQQQVKDHVPPVNKAVVDKNKIIQPLGGDSAVAIKNEKKTEVSQNKNNEVLLKSNKPKEKKVVIDSKELNQQNNTQEENPDTTTGSKEYCETSYPASSSDYIPMSSFYAPSPFAFDSTEYFLDETPPYESPTFPPQFVYTPTHELQPFSPPPMPEIPHFQRRMQMFAARPQQLSLQRAVFQRPFARKRFRHKGDPIVSPVIPQPGSRRRPHHHHGHHNTKKPTDKSSNNNNNVAMQGKAVASTSKSAGGEATSSVEATTDVPDGGGGGKGKNYRPKDQIFQFGNYSHYYGYRARDQNDPRLWVMKKSYFQGKDVLDIGCNAGDVTLSIARDFEPRRVHGIDIDFSLVTAAKRNIKNFMIRDPDNKNIVFPRSLPIIYGAIQPPHLTGEQTSRIFPYNVSFAHENYVLTSDVQLQTVKPEYDVILCLSVTKWIHLNYGDDGLKRFFKRILLHLRSGGILILEPQPWSSYTKKKKITEKVFQMYNSIQFFPDQFEDFLLNEVGFARMESLGTPAHNSKGFQRPLLMFTKAEGSSPH